MTKYFGTFDVSEVFNGSIKILPFDINFLRVAKIVSADDFDALHNQSDTSILEIDQTRQIYINDCNTWFVIVQHLNNIYLVFYTSYSTCDISAEQLAQLQKMDVCTHETPAYVFEYDGLKGRANYTYFDCKDTFFI